MAWPAATTHDVEFFREHGWIVVRNAIDPGTLAGLIERCDEILDRRDTLAFDWAWEAGTPREQREFRIVQASPTWHWPEFNDAPFRHWAIAFGGALLGSPVEFWYDQFLAKPPGRSAPTPWHQDEGYWGRNLDERGITCWMPFHDVDERNGCMHFLDCGHTRGVFPHRRPEHVASDLLTCEPVEGKVVACPIRLGDVTFHHGKTPHMTPANESTEWRRILTQHLRVIGTKGEGDHYPWKVYINQFTGEAVTPRTR
jgi:phytanoyl-CoA hydroxylase